MYLHRNKFTLRERRRGNRPAMIAIYIALILIGLYVIRMKQRGEIQPVFIPTPTATRTSLSYFEEAAAYFSAGKLDKAIVAYQKATIADPTNVDYWVSLTRLQVYAGQLDAALQSADTAILVDPEESMAYTVRALSLDWLGEFEEGSRAAVRAIQLDANNALAHAYYAEILTDLNKYGPAGDEIRLALRLNPNSMDVYRVYGYYLESVGAYEDAIVAYQTAATINPNMSMLYMQLGVNYRVIGEYETAIEYFLRASALDPTDSMPYLSISRTFFQTGEYGRSVQYLESALELDPNNPDIYGRMGLVKHKSMNFEGATVDLQCAVAGCTSVETGTLVEGLPLNHYTLEYYYTYASVLAAYLQCDQAMPIFNQVSAFAGGDEVVDGIVQEGRQICTLEPDDGTQVNMGVSPTQLLEQSTTPSPPPSP